MFRDKNITALQFKTKFISLKKSFDEKDEIFLNSEYHQQMKGYINLLYQDIIVSQELTDKIFDNIREPQMSNLNRLQKLKNKMTYKKDKHKSQKRNEDFG